MKKFRFTEKSLTKFDKAFKLVGEYNGAWLYTDYSVDYFRPDNTGERSASDAGIHHKSFSVLVGDGGVLGITHNGWTFVPEPDMTVTQLIKRIKKVIHVINKYDKSWY